MPSLPVDTDFLTSLLLKLLETPSPTGFAGPALEVVQGALDQLGLEARRTRKGALVAAWAGEADDAPRGLTAHVDTLGAVVKELTSNGRLKLSRLGSFSWNSVEGETCRVLTRQGSQVSGTILPDKASVHVHGKEVSNSPRTDEHMQVRLDARVHDPEDVRALGIDVGDAVAFDARPAILPTGFIRSRHLDDKACVACVLTAVRGMLSAGRQPGQTTHLHFSNYEEVGHGAAVGLPRELAELVAVDMAAVGQGQNSDEFHVTVCAKDSGGPYNSALTTRLVRLAEAEGIPFKVDVYPYYGSDGEAYWRAGGDAALGLIGPGVDASHHYERTHLDALVATVQLITAYLTS